MCNPSAGCVSVDNSLAVCTKYFSLTTSAFSVISSGMYGAGSPYFCESASRAASEYRCLSSPLTMSGGYPQTCITNSDCKASSDASRYQECLCLPNTQGVKYCSPYAGDLPEMMSKQKERVNQDFSRCYNFEIFGDINNCGFVREWEKEWAPQVKAGSWGSCYDAVNMSVTTPVSMSYTGSSSGTCPAVKCIEKGNNAEGYCFAYFKESFLYYVQ